MSDLITNLLIGGRHSYYCRCDICLRYWVLVGPEEVEEGVWRVGPFTIEEFLEAGGKIPQYGPSPDDDAPLLFDEEQEQIDSEGTSFDDLIF